MTDVLDDLANLYKQATEERSHYYTGAVIQQAISEISRLREGIAIAATWTAEPGTTVEEIRAALEGKRLSVKNDGVQP